MYFSKGPEGPRNICNPSTVTQNKQQQTDNAEVKLIIQQI